MYIYVLWCSLKKIAGSEAMRMAQCEVLIMVLQFAQSLLLVGAKVKLGRIRVLTPTPAPTPTSITPTPTNMDSHYQGKLRAKNIRNGKLTHSSRNGSIVPHNPFFFVKKGLIIILFRMTFLNILVT